ncbi:MAG: hypothetical protein EXS35_08095 [Pedosphaera sp.]|nr:hypothetical protein [Pedosphaera sp.]
MKTLLYATLALCWLGYAVEAKEATLTANNQPNAGAVMLTDEVSIGTNEVATVKSLYGVGAGTFLKVIKNGITNSVQADLLRGGGSSAPLPLPSVAGPATIRLVTGGGVTETWNCTVKI